MALSDNSGYCETCYVHKSVLRRLYDGITFIMMCEDCFRAKGYRVKTGPTSQDHRRVLSCHPDLQLKYPCRYAHLGCSKRSDDPSVIQDHFSWCKFKSLVTCSKCWQVIPVLNYDDHKNGARGDLQV
ncbi:hypothetical protein EYR40_003276 [Pleurotus pulmonarius]|nr:hypothetical protein EYR40_003276 [Pleurotus pulmonarius]KAF4606004.1 hypothetical protein EYR38_000049 [Pleurotus pulmonarius]